MRGLFGVCMHVGVDIVSIVDVAICNCYAVVMLYCTLYTPVAY